MKDLIERRKGLAGEVARLNSELKETKEALKEVDRKLLDQLNTMNVDRIVVDGMVYARQDDVVYNATDWDDFYQYVIDNKALFLLQRRLSTKALDELLELDELPPGVEPVEIQKLTARKMP